MLVNDQHKVLASELGHCRPHKLCDGSTRYRAEPQSGARGLEHKRGVFFFLAPLEKEKVPAPSICENYDNTASMMIPGCVSVNLPLSPMTDHHLTHTHCQIFRDMRVVVVMMMMMIMMMMTMMITMTVEGGIICRSVSNEADLVKSGHQRNTYLWTVYTRTSTISVYPHRVYQYLKYTNQCNISRP